MTPPKAYLVRPNGPQPVVSYTEIEKEMQQKTENINALLNKLEPVDRQHLRKEVIIAVIDKLKPVDRQHLRKKVIIALLKPLKLDDCEHLLEEVIKKLRFGCVTNLDDSSQYTGRDSSPDGTRTLDQGSDGEAEGPKNGLNKAVDLNTSAEGQEGQGEPSENQSQRVRKRKIDPAGSVNKRSRFESGTSQTVMGKGEESERDDTSLASSPFSESSYYSNDKDTQAREEQTKESSDEGRAEDDQTENTQAENTRVELALARSIDPEREIKELLQLLRQAQANQSLFARHIECTYESDKVKGKGNPSPQYTGTYYEKMATGSYLMLRAESICITDHNAKISKKLTEQQAQNIIMENFGSTFPKMFTTLVDELARFQEARQFEHATTPASLPIQQVSVPQICLEFRKVLQEIKDLESKSLRVQMKQLRLLVKLRTVYDAVQAKITDIDISSIDTDLRPMIMNIRDYADSTRIRHQSEKTAAKWRLTELVFPGTPKVLVPKRWSKLYDYINKSNVVFAMVKAFSIGCLWMTPTLHSKVWGGHRSGVDQMFDIVKKCDPDGRVQNICQSLKRFTEAYIEAESSLGNVDKDVLDGLEEHPLRCINRLIAKEAGVSVDSGGGQVFD